jgi:hypothetical protein
MNFGFEQLNGLKLVQFNQDVTRNLDLGLLPLDFFKIHAANSAGKALSVFRRAKSQKQM